MDGNVYMPTLAKSTSVIRETILGSLILLNLQHYDHSSLSHDHSQVTYSLPWEATLKFPFLG